MGKQIVKHYDNGEVTVEWRPEKCQHSANCFRSLPEVFNPRVKPWIQPENTDTASLVEVVHKCPSGALSIQGEGADESVEEPPTDNQEEPAVTSGDTESSITMDTVSKVEIEPNGPLKLEGKCLIKHTDGREEEGDWVYFCRCGHSKTKPFCDDSHEDIPPFDPA